MDENVTRLPNRENQKILVQMPEMREREREEFLEAFSEETDKSVIGCCVMGGIFSEGIDLKEECLKVQRQNGVAVEYEQPAGDNENAADIDYSGKRVLVVEDNAINLEIALEFLKLLGLTCESAGDGAEALEKFLAVPEGYYDLIFMDIQMPTMNGYEAARAIRAASRSDAVRIPIIAITANAFSEDVKMALAAGMNAHIAKPFELRLLKKIIRQWLK